MPGKLAPRVATDKYPVEDPCRCLALYIIYDAMQHLEAPKVARWFSLANENFCFWCEIAEVGASDVIEAALRKARAPSTRTILEQELQRR